MENENKGMTDMKKREVLAVKLVGTKRRTSNSYGRNMPYMGYQVFIVRKGDDGERYERRIDDVFTKEELKELGYWSNRSYSMAMTCWGTSQLFEAQLALGSWLGFDRKDWPKFSRRVTKFITEI